MVEHVAIADADRHEVKHASTATARQVLTSNGDGTTQFAFPSWVDVVNKPTFAGFQPVFSAFSSASQSPSALDTPLQVNFGSPQAFADVTLAANGTVTFNTPGNYLVNLFLRFGRTTGAGNAVLFSRFLINDIQQLNSNSISMPDSNTVIPFSTSISLNVSGGDTFKLEVARDSSGVNNGGLIPLTPTVGGWNVSPSATIVVAKYSGAT